MKIDLTGLPPLDFGDPPAGKAPNNIHWHGSLGMRICALMTWPSDLAKRRRFLAAVAAQNMGHVRMAPMPAFWPAQAANVWDAARREHAEEIDRVDFAPHGGLLSVASADSLDTLFKFIRQRSDNWQCVGAQLWVARSIDQYHRELAPHGTSINKAWVLLEHASHWNIDRLKADWRKYKSVAHLCAAICLLLNLAFRKADEGDIPKNHALLQQGAWFFDGLPFLLAAARDYEQWATSYQPFGRNVPLISPEHVWSIPADLPKWEYKVNPPRLDGKFLEALRKYRAPARPVDG